MRSLPKLRSASSSAGESSCVLLLAGWRAVPGGSGACSGAPLIAWIELQSSEEMQAAFLVFCGFCCSPAARHLCYVWQTLRLEQERIDCRSDAGLCLGTPRGNAVWVTLYCPMLRPCEGTACKPAVKQCLWCGPQPRTAEQPCRLALNATQSRQATTTLANSLGWNCVAG